MSKGHVVFKKLFLKHIDLKIPDVRNKLSVRQISDTRLERIRATKLLALYITENFTWNDHISQLSSTCYSTLVTLRKIKNFTPFYLRKQLAEQLIWSKMDYGDLVFNPLPNYLLKRLQKI